ncbi:MAG: outer membrane protein transport protein [Candidatus Omnitrophica bacterium]|nr:outer membrane protein transport protein [Candidatus Omnitrophota bacterium]
MKKGIYCVLGILAGLLCFISPARAGSGAYSLEMLDAEAVGKGDAFVGEADNPSAVYYNSAGLTQLNEGRYVSLGASALRLNQSHYASGVETKSHERNFAVPYFYFADKFKNDRLAVGFGTVSRFGLGTEWANNSFARYSSTKSDLINSTFISTVAYRFTDKLSLGVGFDVERAFANQKKKVAQPLDVGADDANFQLKGKDDFSPGYQLSAMYKVNKRHQFGLTYHSPIHVRYRGKLYLDGLSPTYQFLLNGGVGVNHFETDVSVKSVLPQSVVLGYSFRPTEKWMVNADIQWTDWSVLQQKHVVYQDQLNGNQSAVLNSGNPESLDYHDALSLSLGTEYWVLDWWALRAGYYFHQTPISEKNIQACLPDSNSHSFTLGTGFKFTPNFTFDVAYSAMLFVPRNVDSNFSTATSDLDGEYKTFAQYGMGSMTYKF